jgi:hypothetical protein
MTPFAKIQDDYLGAWNRPLDVKEQLQGFLSSHLNTELIRLSPAAAATPGEAAACGGRVWDGV